MAHSGELDRPRPRPGARADPHARILLKADEGEDAPDEAWSDVKIADALEISRSTVLRVRTRFVGEGLEAALVHRKPKNTKPKKARWLPRGASDRAGLLRATQGQKTLGRAASGRTFREVGVRRRTYLPRACKAHSQKSAIKPWLKGRWSIPPEQDAEFVWRMEDVPEVYTRPYEERFPQVCPDEKGKRLVSEAQEPLAAKSSIDWRFTSADARIKLEHLYPEIVEEPSYDPNLP